MEFAVENAKKLAKRARKMEKQRQQRLNGGTARPSKSLKKSAVDTSSAKSSIGVNKKPRTGSLREKTQRRKKRTLDNNRNRSKIDTTSSLPLKKRQKTENADIKQKKEKKNPVAQVSATAAPASLVSHDSKCEEVV